MNLSTRYCLQAPTSEMGDNLWICVTMWRKKASWDFVTECLLCHKSEWLHRILIGDMPDLLRGVLCQ